MASKYAKMSLADLIAERDEINAVIEEKRGAEKDTFMAEVQAKATQLGLDLGAMFGARPKKTSTASGARTPAKIKYQNPKDPTETWTGRGRPASWLIREAGDDKKKWEKYLVD